MSLSALPDQDPAWGDLDAAAELAAALEDDDGGEQEWESVYPGVEAWVQAVFAPTFVRRTTATFRWCAQWWNHPEAITRLEALWRSWEALTREPTLGTAVWMRDHADHHLPLLTAPAGTFAECDPTRHGAQAPALPTAPAPRGWWDPTPAPVDDETDPETGSAKAGTDLETTADETTADEMTTATSAREA